MSDQPEVHEAYDPDTTPGHAHGQSHVTGHVITTAEPLGELFIDEDGHRRHVPPHADGTPIKLPTNELT